jgi:hypothetical protein
MIITLCGSTSFKDMFEKVYEVLSLEGHCVFMPVFIKDKSKLKETDIINLTLIHSQKILNSDRVYIIDVEGYMGNGTRAERDFAISNNIDIEYLSMDWRNFE